MSAAWGDAEHGDASLVEDQSVFGVVLERGMGFASPKSSNKSSMNERRDKNQQMPENQRQHILP